MQALLLTLGSIPAALPVMFFVYLAVGGAWMWAVLDLRRLITDEANHPEKRREERIAAGNS